MIKNILKTESGSLSALVARTTLAIVMFAHGAQKLLGIWGGYGFEGTMNYFTGFHGMPWILGFLVIVIEFFGSIFLLIGFASRILSLSMILILLSAVFMVHLPNGFYLNWSGTQQGEGIEFFLLAIALALIALIKGGGKWSVDALLSNR